MELVMLIPILAFVTMLLIVLAVSTPPENTVQSRLRGYGYDLSRRAAGDLSQSFGRRVILPILQRIGRTIVRVTPGGMIASSRQRLIQARQPMGLNTFLLLRLIMAVVLPGLFLLAADRGGTIGLREAGIAAFLLYLGHRLPDMWLSLKIDARRDAITKSLPDALDLIVVCVEAGLSLEAAIQRVVDSTHGPLAEEFGQALAEISLGRTRREALGDLSERAGSSDLKTFIAAVLQADQMGVSIADVLRVQAEAMRVRRRQRAEELIAKAPVKMLLPMTVFIFPAIFVVLLGPAGIKIYAMFAAIK